MRRNVEVKARLRDPAAARETAERLSGKKGREMEQEDQFYCVSNGRLKLRRHADGRGELIFYERPNSTGPKVSQFCISPTSDPDGLELVLGGALGVLGVVKKRRLLFEVGQTRIHLDNVEGLGDFVELEVVLSAGQSAELGQRVAKELMEELGVTDEELESAAYLDLMLCNGGGTGTE